MAARLRRRRQNTKYGREPRRFHLVPAAYIAASWRAGIGALLRQNTKYRREAFICSHPSPSVFIPDACGCQCQLGLKGGGTYRLIGS